MVRAARPVQSDSPLRVLIVEDEGIVAYDLSSRLEKLGFEVVGILGSAEEAIEQARTLNPGLILMDVKLDGEKDGIEAAEEIVKKLDTAIIYLTAHTDTKTLDRAKRTGPCGYLTKPLQPNTLPITIDIALYKYRTERELRRQRAWLTTILSTMEDGVAVTNSEGCIQFLNRAAERITGWSDVEAQDRSLSSVLAGSNSDSADLLDELFAGTMARGRPARMPRGLSFSTRDGRATSIDGEIAPSLDEGGAIGAVINFRDDSARKREEKEQRQEHKLRAMGTLAAGVAHDFNNLLFVILGYTEDMRSHMKESFTQNALEYIGQAAQTAAGITKQLLQFTRQQQRVVSKVLDLNDVIRDTEPLLRRLATPKISVQVLLDATEALVTADPDQICQLLVNLTSNARDAMPDGGTLTIKTWGVPVDGAASDEAGDGWMLTVSDTGGGMSEETAERLFEPFYTTKEMGRGTGLGLSIVHGIVGDLGGTICVQSKPNEGSTFEMFLPRSRAMTSPLGESGERQEHSGSAASTILIVGDNDLVVSLITAYLLPIGYAVLTAADGPAALRVAECHPKRIDALITSAMMPGMDGFELAKEFRARGLTRKTIFISGFADDYLRRLDYVPPHSHFLPKPFVKADLLRELAEVLRGSSMAGAA